MKTRVMTFALILLPACDAEGTRKEASSREAEAPGTRIEVGPPVVGLERVNERRTKMRLDLKVGGTPAQMTHEAWSRTAEELLAVDGDLVTRMKVRVLEAAEAEAVNGVPRDKPGVPIAGKTYVLEKEASGTAVTNQAGDAVPMQEKAAIIEQFEDFGQVNPVHRAMASRTFRPGDRFDVLERRLSERKGHRVEGAKATFRRKDEDAITFDVSMTLVYDAPYAMRIPLEGQMRFRAADAWPVSVTLEGDVEGTGAAAKGPEVTGGHLSLRETVSYGG